MSEPFVPDEHLEQQFIALVNDSWDRFDDVERTTWLDDVFIGGVITAHLDQEMFLLDMTSDSVSHSLLFSNAEKDRYIVRLDHSRAEDYAFAKAVGHLATVELGFSRAYPKLGKVVTAAKSGIKTRLAGEGRIEGYDDPGVMKIEVNGTFATCRTSLLVDIADYAHATELTCDNDKIWGHFAAAYQSLRKYLEGIME